MLGVPDDHDLRRLARGIVIDGHRTQPAEAIVQLGANRAGRDTGPRATLLITLREGRNRQVRKMCEAIGHPVDRLKRVAIGPIRDARLKVGQWRELTPAEVQKLRAATKKPNSLEAASAPAPRPDARLAEALPRNRPRRNARHSSRLLKKPAT